MRWFQYCPNCGTLSRNLIKTPCCPDCRPFDLPENIAKQAKAGFEAWVYLVPAAVEVSQCCDLDTEDDHYRGNLDAGVAKVRKAWGAD